MTEYAHDAPNNQWQRFCLMVRKAGLVAHSCSHSHWQIKGGTRCALVNCWPNTKRGFRYQGISMKDHAVQTGSVDDAIRLAGPPPPYVAAPWEDSTEEIPQAIRGADLPVGLIRRFWRWLW